MPDARKITEGHSVIYLQPLCCVDWQGEGRQWCEDDVWPCDHCEQACGGIRYVRVARMERPDDR